ncbi:MAG: hypothetical protein ABWY55_08980 [Microbacterium sp.]
MPLRAPALVPDHDAAALARLLRYGIEVAPGDAEGGAPRPDEDIAAAVRLGAAQRALVVIAPRGDPDHAALTGRIAAATEAIAGLDADPLAVVLLPASLPPQAGPVAVVSPAGGVSSYELYVGAALGAASGRRIEHLNGRGTLGSAVHSGVAGRIVARASTASWRETPHARPERALHTLDSRPAAVVIPVGSDADAVAKVVADHPDADVALVFDAARARHGAVVAEQVAAMVELAFSLSARGAPVPDASPRREPTVPFDPGPAADLPPIRASDVIHVRLTSAALELTNRTRQRLRLRVSLGDVGERDVARAEFEAALGPGDAVSEPTASVPGLDALTPPEAVMRHWSHESEEVYEGGEQRILRLRVGVLDASGTVRAEHDYRPGNGLDYFVTARDLAALLGRPVARSVLPEPASKAHASGHTGDVLKALAAAVRLGAGALDARGA